MDIKKETQKQLRLLSGSVYKVDAETIILKIDKLHEFYSTEFDVSPKVEP